jgi:hypothetical protein
MRIFGKTATVSGGEGKPTWYQVTRFPFKASITVYDDKVVWWLTFSPGETRLADGRLSLGDGIQAALATARSELCEARDVLMRDWYHHLASATVGRKFNAEGEDVTAPAEPCGDQNLPEEEWERRMDELDAAPPGETEPADDADVELF